MGEVARAARNAIRVDCRIELARPHEGARFAVRFHEEARGPGNVSGGHGELELHRVVRRAERREQRQLVRVVEVVSDRALVLLRPRQVLDELAKVPLTLTLDSCQLKHFKFARYFVDLLLIHSSSCY